MLQVSTKFKELILGPASFPSIFLNGSIAIYTGTQPAYADSRLAGKVDGKASRDSSIST